jgi:GntR family transcriptional regulator/MocR family aminotransferase
VAGAAPPRRAAVAIEDPGWRWQRYTVEQAGLVPVPVRVDGDGMVISELAAADVDAVVMTPAHHLLRPEKGAG